MDEINVSLTGGVETVPGDSSAFSTFSLSFSVDGSMPIGNPYLYDVVVPLQNFILNVGGHTYTAASGEIWGQSPANGACCHIDVGINLNQPGFIFSWTSNGGVTSDGTLGGALIADGFNASVPVTGGLAAFVDPPAQSVPEPGTFALLGFALLALALHQITIRRHVNRGRATNVMAF